MNKILLKIVCLFFLFASCSTNSAQTKDEMKKEQESLHKKLIAKATTALDFCKTKNLNPDFCILVDMSIHSGKNRFFVWSFKENKIICQSLCAHGYGKESTQTQPVFSNVEGSYCTSLGRYKIGVRSYSQYGINVHYKMHGYDPSNSNAFKRIVVLHSHNPVPESEIYPKHLPLGWSQGCPVISNNVMTYLDGEFKKIKKPVLLWIYNG